MMHFQLVFEQLVHNKSGVALTRPPWAVSAAPALIALLLHFRLQRFCMIKISLCNIGAPVRTFKSHTSLFQA